MVSEEMIRDSLTRAWLYDWMAAHGSKRPAVIVGEVRNLSHEHINVNTFISDIERALINSGKVDFVASRRITSYNVCYTKLLRVQYLKQSVSRITDIR